MNTRRLSVADATPPVDVEVIGYWPPCWSAPTTLRQNGRWECPNISGLPEWALPSYFPEPPTEWSPRT